MFSSRFFDSPFAFARPMRSALFDSDPFFTNNQPETTRRVSEVDHEQKYAESATQQQTASAHAAEPKTTQQPQRTATAPSTEQPMEVDHQPRSSALTRGYDRRGHDSLSPWSLAADSWWGRDPWMMGDPFRSMDRMMRRMDRWMEAQQREEDELWNGPFDGTAQPPRSSHLLSPDSTSYSYSSSTVSHTGADGQSSSHSTRTERRRLGGVLEETSEEVDSLGNRRTVTKRGLGSTGQLCEVVTDRNQRGEERRVENLRGIKPEEKAQFEQQWKAEAEKAEQQYRRIGSGTGAGTTPAAIGTEQQKEQAQLKAPSAAAGVDSKDESATVPAATKETSTAEKRSTRTAQTA